MDGYRTADMYYAAFLLTVKVPFLGTSRQGNRVFFRFEEVEDLSEIEKGYITRETEVSAMLLIENIRNMKTLTHTARGR
jgi:hypothetical protein